jgi:carnitine-CoA ligase
LTTAEPPSIRRQPITSNPQQPMNIRELIEQRAQTDTTRPFMVFRDQVIDFGTLQQNVNKTANVLADMGVGKGDHVCLFLPNCPEFIYIWFALAHLGGVMVPLNIHLRGDGLTYIINHCDAKWIILDESLYDEYASVEKDLLNLQQRIWRGAPESTPDHFISLQTQLEKADTTAPQPAMVKDSDTLGIIYTSGTTGRPKGAMVTHFNYINTARVWIEDIIKCREDDIFFTALPLFHANAQMFTTMGSLFSGRPFVLKEKFSASRFLDEIRQTKATIFNYIGGILTILMKQPDLESDAKNPLRIAFGGAAPKEIWRDFERRFKMTILEGYGSSENSALPLCNPPEAIRVGSIGKPTRIADVTIWDENNQEVPIGDIGEIMVKEKIPHSMFSGYYKQPDKTAAAWDDGWFHTGDSGYMDEDGYFYFVDRIKDCIRRMGENMSSYEIEKTVNSNPCVFESAAVGVPAELGEDDVKIYVVLLPGKRLDPADLIKFCEERMAYFMVPRYVEFLEAFPKTATERTQKFELRKKGIGEAWDRKKAGIQVVSKP